LIRKPDHQTQRVPKPIQEPAPSPPKLRPSSPVPPPRPPPLRPAPSKLTTGHSHSLQTQKPPELPPPPILPRMPMLQRGALRSSIPTTTSAK